MREAGLPLETEPPYIATQGFNVEAGFAAMTHVLQQENWFQIAQNTARFSGVVCHNDLLAMGAIRALQQVGLRVPEDVSVIGFDDVSEQYAFQPTLTSLRFPRQEMGRRGVQLLSELDGHQPFKPIQNHEVFPVQLVKRQSTGPCRN